MHRRRLAAVVAGKIVPVNQRRKEEKDRLTVFHSIRPGSLHRSICTSRHRFQPFRGLLCVSIANSGS